MAAGTGTALTLDPATDDAALCKGDAGGPALRDNGGTPELVAVNSRSWQGGCLGETETRRGAVGTSLHDIATWLERSPVQRRILEDSTLDEQIGQPVGEEVVDWPYRYQEFERDAQRARLYWSADTGSTHFLRGGILDGFLRLGGHDELGAPTNDETFTADGGAYNDLYRNVCSTAEVHVLSCARHGTIAHSAQTGAHYIEGAAHSRWLELGGVDGLLGYPATEETSTTDANGNPGSYLRFRKDGRAASLYWTSSTGSVAVHGPIHQRWAEFGYEKGGLGFPRIGVTATPDGIGRYVHFAGDASIYWTPGTGAWQVRGAIRQKWASLGWERSYLGYPITDEFAISGGRRSLFESGRIDYSFATGQATAYPS